MTPCVRIIFLPSVAVIQVLRVLQGQEVFLFSKTASSGTHPASYSMGSRVISTEELITDVHLYMAEAKNEWSYTSTVHRSP